MQQKSLKAFNLKKAQVRKMPKKKVCKKCKLFVEGDLCPICKSSSFSTNWQGRINIIDARKSDIAKKIGIAAKGEYAIKVR